MNFLTSDDVSLFYEIDGSGYPLVFLNGLWGDTTTWDNQINDFSKHYKCIRVDHRGICKSDKWLGNYSYNLHATDIKELLDYLGVEKAAFIGTCHGGMTAVTFSVLFPERISVLCINGTQLIKSTRQELVYRSWRHILETSNFETLYKVIIPSIMSESWLSSNTDRLDSMLASAVTKVEYHSAIKLIDACISYGFTENEIGSIQIPALIMAGEEDRFISPHQIKCESNLWTGSIYHLFSDCGHFPQREIPNKYNPFILEYLNPYVF